MANIVKPFRGFTRQNAYIMDAEGSAWQKMSRWFMVWWFIVLPPDFRQVSRTDRSILDFLLVLFASRKDGCLFFKRYSIDIISSTSKLPTNISRNSVNIFFNNPEWMNQCSRRRKSHPINKMKLRFPVSAKATVRSRNQPNYQYISA